MAEKKSGAEMQGLYYGDRIDSLARDTQSHSGRL